jgi:hypothetical protein
MTEAAADATSKGTALGGFGGDAAAATVRMGTAESLEGVLRWLPVQKVFQDYRSEWLHQDVAARLVLAAALVRV